MVVEWLVLQGRTHCAIVHVLSSDLLTLRVYTLLIQKQSWFQATELRMPIGQGTGGASLICWRCGNMADLVAWLHRRIGSLSSLHLLNVLQDTMYESLVDPQGHVIHIVFLTRSGLAVLIGHNIGEA